MREGIKLCQRAIDAISVLSVCHSCLISLANFVSFEVKTEVFTA